MAHLMNQKIPVYYFEGCDVPEPPEDVIERQWINGPFDEFTRSLHTYPSDECHEIAASFHPTCWCELRVERYANSAMQVIHSVGSGRN
jgi:hypothetical protein